MNDGKQFETIINLLQKDMKIIQRADHFSFSIDSLLVSEFATITRTTKNIIDLGTGNGVIPLFLSKKTKAKITGIEIQSISSALAKRNIELNNLQEQLCLESIYSNPSESQRVNNEIKSLEQLIANLYDEWESLA